MFDGEGDTISNVPLTNWSKFIFYLVENCHSHVLLTIFKHFKHQNDNFSPALRAFTTKLYTIFDGFILFSAIFFLIYTLHDASYTVSAKFSGHARGFLTIA